MTMTMTTYTNRDIELANLSGEIKYLQDQARKTFFRNMFNRLANDTTFQNEANQLTLLNVKSNLLQLQLKHWGSFN